MKFSLGRLGARLRARLGPDASSIRQGFVALVIASIGSLVAGVTLGAITDTLERLPGLLVLIPAAIGMRGNIFGALGSRLGTSMHAGTFTLSRRADTVVGQNVLASMALTMSISLALAVLAKAIAVAFGLHPTISVADFVTISVVGGALSSVVVLGITLLVASQSARRDWDMDNVASPLVTAAGDIVTLPAIFLASFLVEVAVLSDVLAAVTALLSVAAIAAVLRSGLPLLRRIVRESLPVLLVAGAVDVVVGLTIEKRLDSFARYPALLVLVPGFLETIGALGGILSSRLSSKLHLGLITANNVPQRAARLDFLLIVFYAVPIFTFGALSADLAARIIDVATPGRLQMVGVALSAGLAATFFTVLIVYYGSIATFRLGLDPDNHSIPMVTSSMDLIGAICLILAVVTLGVA